MSASPAHFIVNSTGDGFDAIDGDGVCETATGNGICTLRAAVAEANTNGNPLDTDLITFNIMPLDGNVKTIVQDGDAPYSFRQPVVIDGYTQDDATPNTNPAPQPLNGKLLIEIDGSASTYGAAFNVVGPQVTIKGLVMNRYKSSPISIFTTDAADVNIQGNYFETDTTGMTQMTGAEDPYAPAIAVADGSGVLIGGPNPEDRNVLTHTASGVIVNGASDVTIQGNNFMVASDGVTPLSTTNGGAQNNSSQSGITLINSSNITIGGTSSGESNDIENDA